MAADAAQPLSPTPADPTASSDTAGATLQQIDTALPAMRRLIADLPRLAGNPGPDHTGRRLEDDIASTLLREPVLQRMAQLRAELPNALAAGSDRVPPEALRPLAELHATELCRIVLLASYWQVSTRRDYHRDLVREQIKRQAAARQTEWLVQMQAIDQRAYSHQQRAVTLDSNECAAEKFRARMQYEDEAVIADYNALRMQIADEEFVAREAADAQPAMTARDRPCPADAGGTTGKSSPAIRSVPDLTNFYPDPLRRPNVEGVVRVAVDLDAAGCVTAAGIAGPSGADLLDQAAIRVAFEMQFTPAQVAGRPVGGRYAVPIRFRLPVQPQP
jgi:TonB family protein